MSQIVACVAGQISGICSVHENSEKIYFKEKNKNKVGEVIRRGKVTRPNNIL